MIEPSGHNYRARAVSPRRDYLHLKYLQALLALTLLLPALPTRADGPDDDYLQIYGAIQKADELNTNGKADLAKTKYLQAMTDLTSFKSNYPYWNKQLVSLRLSYLKQKISALSAQQIREIAECIHWRNCS